MRILNILLLISITSITMLAQAPSGFNYQGVARDLTGEPLTNTSIGLQLTVVNGGPNGNIIYQENHQVTTTDLGLFQTVIGTGNVVDGNFESIVWGSANLFLEVGMDISGGSNYQSMGASQMWSVPYALHANNGTQWSKQNQGISYPQGAIGIGIQDTDPSALLELSSTKGGLLLPRVKLLESTNHEPLLSHVEGMMVYNTNTINDVTPGVYINDGVQWMNISSLMDKIQDQADEIEKIKNSVPIKRAVFVAGQSNTMFGIGSAQIPDFASKNLLQLGRAEVNLQEVPLTFYGSYHHSRFPTGGNFGSIFLHHYYEHLQSQFPGREVQLLMVPCGSGGSGWAASQFPSNSWRTDAPFMDDLIQRIKWVKNNGYDIDAFLWHQGETDAINQTVNYKDILYNFIQSVRDYAGNSKLPFILGEMVPSWVASAPNLDIYQDIINEVKNEIPYTAVASGLGLSLADAIHYDADAHVELGKRYFDQYLISLQNENPVNYNSPSTGEHLVYNFNSSSGETFPSTFAAIRFGASEIENRYSTLGDIWKYQNDDGYHFKVEVIEGQGIEGGIFEWKQKYNPFGLNENNFEDRAAFEILNNTIGLNPETDHRFASLVYDAQTDANIQFTLFHADVRATNNFWFFSIGQVANFANLIPLVQNNNTVTHIRMSMIKD